MFFFLHPYGEACIIFIIIIIIIISIIIIIIVTSKPHRMKAQKIISCCSTNEGKIRIIAKLLTFAIQWEGAQTSYCDTRERALYANHVVIVLHFFGHNHEVYWSYDIIMTFDGKHYGKRP